MEQLSRAFICRKSLLHWAWHWDCTPYLCSANFVCVFPSSLLRWRHSSKHAVHWGRCVWTAEDATCPQVLLPIRLLPAARQHSERDIWAHAGNLIHICDMYLSSARTRLTTLKPFQWSLNTAVFIRPHWAKLVKTSIVLLINSCGNLTTRFCISKMSDAHDGIMLSQCGILDCMPVFWK